MDSPKTIEEVYDQYSVRLYQFCFRLCGSRTDAEDLTQETLILAWQRLASFRGGSLRNWLFTIALHRWKRFQKQRPPASFSLEERDVQAPDPAPGVMQSVLLSEALASLPDDLREPFILVKAERLTYREAAEVLNEPLYTVAYRVKVASEQLRSALAEPQTGTGPIAPVPTLAS